jgi:hypothetical protein
MKLINTLFSADLYLLLWELTYLLRSKQILSPNITNVGSTSSLSTTRRCHLTKFILSSRHVSRQVSHCCSTYTGCPGRNVKNVGRVFLMLKYTDITQNTYIQSWTVTEIKARKKCGLLWGRRTVAASWQPQRARPSVWYRITSPALSLTCIPSGW